MGQRASFSRPSAWSALSSARSVGKAFDGEKLLFLFALVMVAVGVLMLRPPQDGLAAQSGRPEPAPPAFTVARAVALMVGALSGFFGIGGGFLIVPGLVFATGMPLIQASAPRSSPLAPSALRRR